MRSDLIGWPLVHGAGLVGGAGRALARARARTGAREKAQGHREVLWPAGTLSVTSGKLFRRLDIFSDRSPRFPINRGRGGGRVRNFFRNFFFFREFWGGGGWPRTPEARVARFLVGMFRNRFFEAGVDARVSPIVSLDQAIDEKVSPNFYIFKLTEVKKCHQMWSLRWKVSPNNLVWKSIVFDWKWIN